MALVLANRVQESATANTTVSFTLTGAIAGFQSFAVIGDTNTTFYSATDGSGNWEVGLGTYSTTGPTLTRTTIYASSNSNNAVTFSGAVNVFVTYPSGRSVNLDASGNVSALGTIASGTWQGTTIGVAYGGTGVTASSGANSVVLRDANSNITVNRVSQANTSTTAAGGTTALTAASSYIHTLVGTGGQTYTLPDATTLTTGVAFVFNNMATGTLTIQNYATGSVGTIPSGGAGAVFLTTNTTTGGTWDIHAYLPEGVTFGTNAFNLGTSVISGGTWQGGTIQPGYGGTGLTTFVGANNALYSTGASTLTAGTLPTAAGGTGLTSFTANRVFYASSTSAIAQSANLTFDGTTLTANALTVSGNANVTGNVTLGDASTDTVTVNGYMGVGGATPAPNTPLRIGGTLSGSVTQIVVYPVATFGSTASQASGVKPVLSTEAASFTLPTLSNFRATDATKGAGSTITSLNGLYIEDLTSGTNNYGITSAVSSGSNKWNIYASGTAANYFAGNVGIGVAPATEKLHVVGGDVLIGTDSGSSFNGDAFLRIQSSTNAYIGIKTSTTGATGLLLGDTDDSFVGGMQYQNSTDTLSFNAANAERLSLSSTATVFNELGANTDFRVESDTNTHALFVQGSDGNVGIGTSSPSARLDVVGSTGILTRAAATQDGIALVGRAGGTSSYEVTLTPTTLSADRTLTLPDNSGTVLTSGATVTVAQGGTGQTTYTNGELLIGNTTGNTLTKSTLTGTANQITVTNGGGSITLSLPQSINTGASVQFGSLGVGTAASGTTGEIRATNNITAYYSDDRLKNKLGKIENALDKLCSLEGFYYEANETAQALGYEVKREVGVSAQAVQAVMPEIVAPAPIDEQYLTVRYERALPLVIEAIKELRAEIAEIKKVVIG